MNDARILVADDEPDLRGLTERILVRAGYEVVTAEDGRAALETFFAQSPALVVLDISMPQIDGWTVLTRIRETSDVPVIMLTARAGEMEKVRALRGGADDYLTKPFGQQEFIARVEAALRRAPVSKVDARYEDAVLSIDHPTRQVQVAGDDVQLTPLEFRLLSTLVQHAGEVLSTERLCELVWDDPSGIAREQVKLYVGYVRKKLATHAPEGWFPIENLRGHGYRFVPATGSSR